MITVVIPTYNRINNLKLSLAALDSQIDPPEFEVIVADDGSDDGTRQFCEKSIVSYSFDMIYQWCGPNLGFRPQRTRNIGAAQSQYNHVWFVDSDVVLNPHALHHQGRIREKFPDIVVVGMYHFSDKGELVPSQVRESYDHVMALVPNEKSGGPPLPGLDNRIDGFHEEIVAENIITEYDGLGFWGGNCCWPAALFWIIGAYDERMPSGQGEDAELGQRMRKAAVPVMQFAPVYGVHMWHERNVALSQALVNESIAYIDLKHGVGTYDEVTDPDTDPREMNKSVWYTRIQGAKLVRVGESETVFAVDGTEKHYVGLPDAFWLKHLGFLAAVDIEMVERDYFNGKIDEGVIVK